MIPWNETVFTEQYRQALPLFARFPAARLRMPGRSDVMRQLCFRTAFSHKCACRTEPSINGSHVFIIGGDQQGLNKRRSLELPLCLAHRWSMYELKAPCH
jgi:hypothetical protein